MRYGTYFVEKHEKCPKCRGNRYITHPLWKEYFNIPEEEDIGVRDWFAYQGIHPIPPEEIECDECNGRGKVVSKVLLEDALKDLGVLKDDDIEPWDLYASS